MSSILVRGANHGRRNRKLEPGSAEQKLLAYLFRDYDLDARGVSDINETVKVTIELLLLRIQGLVSYLQTDKQFSSLCVKIFICNVAEYKRWKITGMV